MLLHINVEAYRAEFPDLRTYQFANSAWRTIPRESKCWAAI